MSDAKEDTRALKRPRPGSDAPPAKPADDDTSSDDDIGPSLPPAGSAPKKKKRRTLAHEKLYLAGLPSSTRYSKSLMHRENLAFITMTPYTDFLITTSIDGVVKFWKKIADGLEFVKAYRAHTGAVVATSVSSDGRSFATAGVDCRIALFDVLTFELLARIEVENTPRTVCWCHKRGSSLPMLAFADAVVSEIVVFDGRPDVDEREVGRLKGWHRAVVHLMVFNDQYNTVVSCDEGGMVEYWSPRPERNWKADGVFEFKAQTGLFAFKKAKSVPTTITVSPTQNHFATFSHPDRQIRLFDFPTGKLLRTYDESLTTLQTLHQASSSASKLPELDFNRRMATESALTFNDLLRANILFDESGNFLLYGSLSGIKVLNHITNKHVLTIGGEETIRPMNLAVYQGAPLKKGITTIEMAASANPLLMDSNKRDPTLFCTAHQRSRFYLFTHDSTVAKSERDIYNEKPLSTATGGLIHAPKEEASQPGAKSVVMHTSMGDIHLRLYPEAAPKAVENFTTLSKAGYYNNTIFHRVIKKFMIQGGDPLGDGTGGESCWGKEFEDEFSSLRHDKPYTLSMANAGPGTNGSQFFITTEKTPWLDGKHTIFGRAVKGLDVIHKIENVRVSKGDKPEDDIKIVNISVV